MNRRKNRLGAGLALLVAWPLTGAPAAPTSAGGGVLVSGTLTGTGGQTAQLNVYADAPAPERPNGAEYRQTLVAQAQAAGKFRIVVDGEAVGLAAIARNGSVDFTVTATAGNRRDVYVFSRRVDADGNLLPEDTSIEHSGSTPGTAGAVTTGTDALAADVTLALRPGSSEPGPAPGSNPVPQRQCYPLFYYPNINTWIGTAYHNYPGARQRLTYWQGSHSYLGWGLRVAGESWQVGGTTEREVSEGLGTYWDTLGNEKHGLITQWTYRRYECREWNAGRIWIDYEARPDEAEGGAYRRRGLRSPSTPSAWCELHTRRSGYVKKETKNWNWTNGVKIGSIIGIDLNSRSGYTRETKINTRFTRRLWVCGVRGPAFRDPGQVVYKLRR
jgi:hypothetical protein